MENKTVSIKPPSEDIAILAKAELVVVGFH
jgi:hypothetical protein